MTVTIIPIVIGAFGTVTKWLLNAPKDLEAGGRVETIQTTALLRLARILRRFLETWGVNIIIALVYKEIEASTKIPVLTLFEGAEFKFEIRFYSSPLVFFRCA